MAVRHLWRPELPAPAALRWLAADAHWPARLCEQSRGLMPGAVVVLGNPSPADAVDAARVAEGLVYRWPWVPGGQGHL